MLSVRIAVNGYIDNLINLLTSDFLGYILNIVLEKEPMTIVEIILGMIYIFQFALRGKFAYFIERGQFLFQNGKNFTKELIKDIVYRAI